ncbi:hypothetical protein CC80DRAFT_42925 [Byssothecium circinans]|uniref:Ubiquitin interaction motif protein n=1 Tax=Byssothecium circinans TaxID=147558 RepID=A0A6A5TYE9_9PLEO|nr:hypothetical protein CC80DRAFT_42925 [Byssothecium circinans]
MSLQDLDTLREYSGRHDLTDDQARHILKLGNNDISDAVLKIVEEGVSALLAQSTENTWDQTFNIDYAPGVEHYPHSGGPSGAPTRPSSRTSHRSNVSTHAGDVPRQSVETDQESGVIGGSGAVFGPANQDTYYDNASWAMVPIAKSIEYIPDAILFDQIRSSETPAFLKPATSPEYLPALLTILHTIPLYRNALLTPNVTLENYGLGDEWWKGNAGGQARTVDNDADVGSTADLELVHETQRLMAFLDKSVRSYASLDTLFQLDTWKQSQLAPDEPAGLDDLLKFLMRWSFLYKRHHQDAVLRGVFESAIWVQGEIEYSFIFDVPVMPNDAGKDRHLYDVLDSALFPSLHQTAHITDASDVLILRMTGAKLDCTIPSIIYVDRYMAENKDMVMKMFADSKEHEDTLQGLDAQIDTVKFHRPQGSDLPEKMETLKMLETSMHAFDPEQEGNKNDPTHATILTQLKTLYDNVQQKLNSLIEEKSKVRDALDSIAASFRAPVNMNGQFIEKDRRMTAKYPYKLQGVVTSATEFYVLHPKTDAKTEKSTDEVVEQQWWHIKYNYTSSSDSATINRTEVGIDTVCADAGANPDKTLIIYANEAALSLTPIPLSAPLSSFVEADNVAFKEDVERRKVNKWGDHDPSSGSHVVGDWDKLPNDSISSWDDGYDWENVSAKEFHQRGYGTTNTNTNTNKNTFVDTNGGGSGISSSRTLTPNTEVDDDEMLTSGGLVEMQEVNGGIQSWAGITSNASSETVGLEPMEIVGESQQQQNEPRAGVSSEPVNGVKNEGRNSRLGDVEMVDADTEEVKDAVRKLEDGANSVEHIEVVEKKGG